MDYGIKRNKYKVIFSDIDGTLLDTSHQIAEQTKEKIKEIDKQGIPFVLVSARMPKGMRGIRDELEIKRPMVCYSGALVVNERDEILYSVTLNKREVEELCKNIQKRTPTVSINLYSNDSWLVQDLEDVWVKQEMEITGVQAKQKSLNEQEVYHGVHKVLCMGSPSDIMELEQQLADRFPTIRIYRSKDTYLEIMSMEASKSGAVRRLEECFGVTKEETIAIGDGHNDIDMLEYAGLGIAMGNACKEVKEAADFVTGTNDSQGLRMILEQAF